MCYAMTVYTICCTCNQGIPRHASREHLEDSIVSTSRNLGRFEAPGSSRRPAGLRDPAILHAMCVAGRRGPLLARNNHERLHSIRPLTRDRRQTKPAAASIGVRRDSTQGRRTRRAPSSATATACRHARAALSPPAPATLDKNHLAALSRWACMQHCRGIPPRVA
jgi:hypothetical protein